MRTVLTVGLWSALIFAPVTAWAQQGVPVVNLPAASARSSETFGAILGLHQASDGKVLVNDALRRQMRLVDASLASSTIVLDSGSGSTRSYGRRPTPLIPFLGDSSLFADWNSRTVIVLDGHGQVVRTLALPRPQDMVALNASSSGFDTKGRLIYRGGRAEVRGSGPGSPAPVMGVVDSLPILRADLESRRVDTIARISRPAMKLTTQKASDGAITTIYTPDPLQAADDWALLSNGSVAIVRGHDYHVDWISPDGAMSSTAKLPFDWKRLTDDDKQKLSDSLRGAQNPLLEKGYPAAELTLRGPMSCTPPDGGRGGDGGRGVGRSGGSGEPPPSDAKCFERLMSVIPQVGAPLLTRPSMPPLADLYRPNPIPDYAPPIRVNASMPDLDGNAWILPRMSTLSQNGELVYDVVNAKGELFERVRLPLGRAIVGFAKSGVVYLTSGDMTNGFHLERTTLGARGAAKK
ncbi:MAG TPA: hypothetical protein VK636_21150 [Gemmatimonadaceae bacterium]|nr:hypothetical protein [Gemmatimonadaceae bacterium]